MKLKNARITFLVGRDKTTIELRDDNSLTTFAEITLTPEQLSSALSRMAHTECEIELMGLDKVGKTHEHKVFEFELPKSDFMYRKEIAKEEIKKVCPKGWIPDISFSSQNSFYEKDGKDMARTYIRRYI